jgi:peroxiredoxin family protein
MDMMDLSERDLVGEVDGVVGAMEFLEMAEGAQIVFI